MSIRCLCSLSARAHGRRADTSAWPETAKRVADDKLVRFRPIKERAQDFGDVDASPVGRRITQALVDVQATHKVNRKGTDRMPLDVFVDANPIVDPCRLLKRRVACQPNLDQLTDRGPLCSRHVKHSENLFRVLGSEPIPGGILGIVDLLRRPMLGGSCARNLSPRLDTEPGIDGRSPMRATSFVFQGQECCNSLQCLDQTLHVFAGQHGWIKGFSQSTHTRRSATRTAYA